MEPREAVAKYFGEDMQYDPYTMKWSPSNPCSEISLRSGEPAVFSSDGKVAHSTLDATTIRAGNIVIHGDIGLMSWKNCETIKGSTMRQKNYKRDYDEDTFTVEVPGVPKSEIEVFTQKNVLYVKIREESPITYVISDEQTIRSVKLDLGILTIVIDNSEKRKLLEID